MHERREFEDVLKVPGDPLEKVAAVVRYGAERYCTEGGFPMAAKVTMSQHESTGAGDLSGVVDAILDVGRQRKLLLDQMRNALESGNSEEALGFARKLCGLTNEKSSRTN
jgi:hypothetical protein